jgi:hypothetical protein
MKEREDKKKNRVENDVAILFEFYLIKKFLQMHFFFVY